MSRKPTPRREPMGVMNKKPGSAKNSLPKITSQAEFDSIARVYHQNTPYALPHAMFVIDRKNKNRIYYVNSQKYRFHKDFLTGNYLVLKGEDIFENVYIKENRRFIVGTIAWQKTVEKFTFEHWEGDMIPADLIKLTHDVINKTFFKEVSFKPNSIRQDELSADLGIKRVLSSEISQGQEYLALNAAKGIGRVHIIEKLDDTVEIGYNEIVVLKEAPVTLPPVSGIIVSEPSTPLSHINILAKGWGIPNVYIKNAGELFKEWNGKWIEFEANLVDYKIKFCDTDCLNRNDEERKKRNQVFKSPPSNLEVVKLASLGQMRRKDSVAYGAKAANLAEVYNAKLPGISVPDGFTVPFYYYDKFMKDNGLDAKLLELLDTYNFIHNPRFRRQKLEELRAQIQNGKFDEELKTRLVQKWTDELGAQGVFVRSSSNSEDMPNFSGAGLYTTVPNVKDADKLVEAVKTVWASLWNFEAYEARERNFIEHTGVYMGVLIQTGVNTESSGVMITKDPFDKENQGAVYISAKRGLGIKVVEGKRIAEQILFSKKSNAVQVLTRSDEETLLTFDENGGVKEIPISGARAVLTDKVARDLVRAGTAIKRIFGNKTEQDIEWGYAKGQIYIFQSRPYIEN
jgi:hypothetical protein